MSTSNIHTDTEETNEIDGPKQSCNQTYSGDVNKVEDDVIKDEPSIIIITPKDDTSLDLDCDYNSAGVVSSLLKVKITGWDLDKEERHGYKWFLNDIPQDTVYSLNESIEVFFNVPAGENSKVFTIGVHLFDHKKTVGIGHTVRVTVTRLEYSRSVGFSRDSRQSKRPIFARHTVDGVGKDGLRGPQGLPGRGGPTGPRGYQGREGPMGMPGRDGRPGLQGVQGPIGADGPTGSQGSRGPPGPPSGITGARGPRGRDGKNVDLFIRKVSHSKNNIHITTERTLIIDRDDTCNVYLPKCEFSIAASIDMFTSRILSIINVGDHDVSLHPATNDMCHDDVHTILTSGSRVTIQNYKNTWYCIS
jgi:hypothetical protein